MCNRPHVTIDASVIAVPQIGCSPEEVYAFIETILDWRLLLDQPWIAITFSESCSIHLIEEELYPLRPHLVELFNLHKVHEFDVNTVSRVIDRLLSITPSFETFFKLKDILAEPIETDPDIIKLVSSKKLQGDLAQCVLLLAILKKHCRQPLGGHSLILRSSPNNRIKVRALIQIFEHDRDDINNISYEPDFFEGDVLACDNFRGLINCLDESAILMGAVDNAGIELAIRIFIYKEQINRGNDPEWDRLLIPIIGREFRLTCQQCCNDQGGTLPPRILRSIQYTIENQSLANVHALRVGRGPNDRQRTRNGDKAQRRDIDYEFHLHYWDCDDGSIELASVVHHNDFSIPD